MCRQVFVGLRDWPQEVYILMAKQPPEDAVEMPVSRLAGYSRIFHSGIHPEIKEDLDKWLNTHTHYG